MSESPETPKILEQIAKGTGTKTAGRSSRSQQTARRRFYILLVLFVPVLAGLSYVAYFQLSIQQRIAELESGNSELVSRIVTYEQQLAALTAELAALPDQVQVDNSATEEMGARLESELNDVRAELQSLSIEQQQLDEPQQALWKILEAEYLLDLAARKLQFEADIGAAALLLEQADTSLRDSGNSGVFSARQAISADLAALRSVEPVDREGLFIRLQNLIDQVAEIPLQGSMRDEFQNRQRPSGAQQATVAGEPGMLDRTLGFLGTVFVWRSWEEMPEAMLAPGQDLLIRQRLGLTLEQLQHALTRNDEALFSRGLVESLKLFEDYVVTAEPVSQALLSELRALQSIDINPALPGLTASRESVAQLAEGLR